MATTATMSMSYLHVPRKTPFTGLTVGQQLYKAAEKFGDKEMYVFYEDKERISFQQMKEKSQHFAASLASKGMKRGDRLAIWGNNHSEWLVSFYACAQLGILLVPFRMEFPIPTVATLLRKIRCKALVLTRSPSDLTDRLQQLIPEIRDVGIAESPFPCFPDLELIIYEDRLALQKREIRSMFSLTRFLNCSDITLEEVDQINSSIDMDEPCLVYFTSGTTGIPKPAVLSHHTIVNNAMTAGAFRSEVDWAEANWESVRYANCMSFAGSGSFVSVFTPLVRGSTTIVLFAQYTSSDKLAKAIQDERVTEGSFFINHMAELMELPNLDTYDFTNLRIVTIAGSTIPEKLRNKVSRIVKYRTTLYGMSEILAVLYNHPLDSQNVLDEDAMYPVGGTEMKIVNDEGQIVPVNTQGELLVRGYPLLLYYWGEEEKTREFKDSNGWAHTGDIAVMDQNGFIRFRGRKKELIIKNAVNLAPIELEKVLHTHPGIVAAMVVGVPDATSGEEVCACVRVEKKNAPKVEEIIEFCKGKVLTLLVPKYVVFVDRFPTTETGKFSRKQMATTAMEMLELSQEL